MAVRAKLAYDVVFEVWRIQVQIRDTGSGISKAEINKLFKLFGMVQNTKEQNSNGIGLGLLICKGIAE